MANSYGGTVYLGVQDTGTARGLEEDLKFFGDNRDKYDLHVRNSIHEALGNAVNMSCHIEHPDAGKHYIYAIKVAASKTPVMLKTDNQYYLRRRNIDMACERPGRTAEDYGRARLQQV